MLLRHYSIEDLSSYLPIPMQSLVLLHPTHRSLRHSAVHVNRATECRLKSRRWTLEYSVEVRLDF